ncbi:Patatin-like phospholipase [Andreprevotia lacus DSM 23236]|jgi:patatin-like phospholipase/acyl hydrolase|uniref:Patatin-like phospholipase n=1 Tax=Andreprevotia lacus DSM 23236 TaxID=1121001 RepID=A0A1W1XGN8_9NEIS|nr:patatin-like phospholipase family protein [Andreprevotia lacus]SMC23110.1 Patatin-like phospholipase [Andreprevotia lacus DSM 23236]
MSSTDTTAPYRILSLDGGGLRGIIPLVVLKRLDAARPGWRDGINMFAGTSTGALIALGLAKGMTPDALLDIYVNKGGYIFARSLWHEIVTLGGLIGPKYASHHRGHLSHEMLGDATLGHFLRDGGHKGHVVVASFNAEGSKKVHRWRPKIFHNLPVAKGDNDAEAVAHEVAMYTSAAPTYFGAHRGYIDGGVYANNPSMCALAQTQDSRLQTPIPFDTVHMLSLGTGYSDTCIDGSEQWGVLEWAPKLVSVLTDGVNEVADFQVRQLLGDARYQRVSAPLQGDVKLDDVNAIPALLRAGEGADITHALQLISSW